MGGVTKPSAFHDEQLFFDFLFVIDIDSCTWVIPQLYVLHLLYVVCSGVRHSSCEPLWAKDENE